MGLRLAIVLLCTTFVMLIHRNAFAATDIDCSVVQKLSATKMRGSFSLGLWLGAMYGGLEATAAASWLAEKELARGSKLSNQLDEVGRRWSRLDTPDELLSEVLRECAKNSDRGFGSVLKDVIRRKLNIVGLVD